MNKYKYLVPAFLLAAVNVSRACDSCGCEYCDPGLLTLPTIGASPYAISQMSAVKQSYFFLDLAEQYTDFGTLRNVPAGTSTDQYENSFQTQFIVGYQINQDLDIQLNVPYIYRNYRIEDDSGDLLNGQVNGLGDIRLIVNYMALRKETTDWSANWRVSGGLKIPTGKAGLLDLESPSYSGNSPLASGNTAVGGHDVALGSGSYDVVLGTGVDLNWHRAFFDADADYTIRGTGEAGYRYSNELGWSAGPGYRVWQDDTHSLSVQFRAAGEYKAADTVQGELTDDTFVSTVALGPNVMFTWSNVLAAHIQLEVPVVEEYDPGFQALPTFRIKAGITFRF